MHKINLNSLKHPYFLLSISLIVIVYALLASYQRLKPLPMLAPSAYHQQSQVNRLADFQSISGWHLFGAAPPKKLPETSLQLRLVGIYTSQSAQQAQAVITSPSKTDTVYQVGDSIDGVIIQNILSDRVILKNNKRLEVLTLPKQTLNFQPKPQGFNDDNAP